MGMGKFNKMPLQEAVVEGHHMGTGCYPAAQVYRVSDEKNESKSNFNMALPLTSTLGAKVCFCARCRAIHARDKRALVNDEFNHHQS